MILNLSRLGFSHHHQNHHHHHQMSEVNLASLQAFRSLVSGNLNRTLESLKLESDFLSITWIHQCFQMLTVINKAFAKLMVEIDYPVNRWETSSIDEYLDYTINLLDLINSISSSIARVNQDRVSITCFLTLMERSPDLALERMKKMKMHDSISIKKFKASGGDHLDHKDYLNRNEQEWLFHEAMMVLRKTGFWVCGVVLSGLNNRVDPIMDIMRNMVSMDSSLMALDSIFKKKFMEVGGIMKEVEAVNESVRLITSCGINGGGMEFENGLKVVENGLKGLKEEEECVFGCVMAARNEVIEMLRRNHN